MKKKLFLGLLAAAAVSFTACQKDEVISEMPQDNAIGFGTYVGRDAQTKATSIDDAEDLQKDSRGFGVFAYYTGETSWEDTEDAKKTPAFMNNIQVTYSSGSWGYTTDKYWPGNTNKYQISFFAYAPYVANANITTNGDPTISFTDPATLTDKTVSDQIDLLYATPVIDEFNGKNSNAGKVSFTFNHALSRIGFKVKTARKDYRVNISKITLTGDFNTTGTLNLNDGAWYGENNETDDDEYTLNFTNNDANATAISNDTDGEAINADEGYVMTIPTDFTSNNLSVSVEYTYEYEVSQGVWATAVEDTKNGTVAVKFVQGSAYTLVMTLDPLSPITFNVTSVIGWDESHPGFNPGTDVTIQ